MEVVKEPEAARARLEELGLFNEPQPVARARSPELTSGPTHSCALESVTIDGRTADLAKDYEARRAEWSCGAQPRFGRPGRRRIPPQRESPDSRPPPPPSCPCGVPSASFGPSPNAMSGGGAALLGCSAACVPSLRRLDWHSLKRIANRADLLHVLDESVNLVLSGR